VYSLCLLFNFHIFLFSMADVESINGKLKTKLETANALVVKKEDIIAIQHWDIIKMRKHIAQANVCYQILACCS